MRCITTHYSGVLHLEPKKMIKIEDLKKITKLVLLSGYIKNSKPLSMLIVGNAGTGKTEIISSYHSQRVEILTDLSYSGLIESMKKKGTLKHIVIPDFIKITQKKRSTSDNLISLLNAVTEEGVKKIRLFNVEHDLKGRVLGIITATTKKSAEQRWKAWQAMGFVSRMLIISFDYSEDTIKEVMDYINSEEFLNNGNEKIQGFKDTFVVAEKELNSQFNAISEKKFRTLKQLQTLAKAHAILRHDTKVTQQDVDEILRLSRFFNLKYTKI